MPLTQQLASAMAAEMDQLRTDGTLPWLHPDAELQVTVHYDVDGESQAMIPRGVSSVSIVYGHLPELRPVDPEKELLEKVVKVVIPSQWLSASTDYLFTMRERKSGSRVAGVSGRRTVEMYGGWVACGASAVGRDMMNLSHCGQLAACWAAKSLVASKLCRRCAVQLRYLPTLVPSVQVEAYGAADAKNLEQLLLQHFDFRPSSLRESLLGANLLLQCFLFIFLAKGASPRLEFGRHLLAILHSFLRLGVIFTVLFLVFASFTSAYLVMGSRLPLRALIEKVYRGLFLADGEGLDVMEGGSRHGELQPNNLDTYLTLLSTFIVTICLLNVSIAVFTMEYEAAIKESWLHFWRWRARLCTEVLLCPRWPWKFESKKSLCAERRIGAEYLEWAVKRLKDEVLPTVYNSRFCQRTFNLFGYRISWEPLGALDAVEDEERDEDAAYVRLVGWLACGFVTILGLVLLFLPFVHGVFSGICIGIGLTILKSLCARGPYGNGGSEENDPDSEEEDERPRGAARPHFLWICYRSDYDANVFMNKEVHKEHLDQLEYL
eukprot:symbB.v1.2.006064.t1/scaffold352.1/size221597/6